VLQDEAAIKLRDQKSEHIQFNKLKASILDGRWEEVLSTCQQFFKDSNVQSTVVNNTPHQSFLYAVHRQRYLEYLERREIQHAFTYLTKRIKCALLGGI
jgi:hypothetical protein